MPVPQYPWKRFWLKRGDQYKLTYDGYLEDPDESLWLTVGTELKTLEELSGVPCLILLGEPGIGKSTSLLSLRSIQECSVVTSKSVWHDLAVYSSETGLRQEVFNSDHIDLWRRGSESLLMLLDSLDECRIEIPTIARILREEIRRLPKDRLRLRIACRTAEWPSTLEDHLREHWGDRSVEVYELLPLRRKDVEGAARSQGIDAGLLMQQISKRSASPLAIKPVTLDFLLRTYKDNGMLPATRRELYSEGCRLLSEESNRERLDAGHSGDHVASQRLAAARKIAATNLFCGRNLILIPPQPSPQIRDGINRDDLVGGEEPHGGEGQVKITLELIKETLDTGLFSGAGPDRLGWAHQTYAEFLASEYLQRHELALPQYKTLLQHPDGKIVPQLHGVAAWCATNDEKVFRWIAESEPEIPLRGDAAGLTDDDRATLIQSFLDGITSGKVLDDGHYFFQDYSGLKNSRIEDQLRPYVAGLRPNDLARAVAIEIAEDCHVDGLVDDFVHAALDALVPFGVRVHAVSAIRRIGNSEAKEKLRPLMRLPADEDPDDELKGVALSCLWPDLLIADDLFSDPAILSIPRNPRLFGSYKRFLQSGVADAFTEPRAIITALEWIAVARAEGRFGEHFYDLADSILAGAVDHLPDYSILGSLARLLWDLLRSDSYFLWHGWREESACFKKLQADADLRHTLAGAIFTLVDDPKQVFRLVSPAALVGPSDTDWLLRELEGRTSTTVRGCIVALISRVMNPGDVAQLDAVIAASRQNPALANEFRWLLEPVILGSPEADRQRKWYDNANQRPPLDPQPERRIARRLDEFESGNTGVFVQLLFELTLSPDSTDYGDFLNPDLSSLPGWLSADEPTRGRIIAAGCKYLADIHPSVGNLANPKRFDYSDIAGYKVLILLASVEGDLLTKLSAYTWGAWIPIVFSPPIGTDFASDPRHQRVMKDAWRLAPDAVLTFVSRLIDWEFETEGNVWTVGRLDAIWDDRVAALLTSKLSDERLTPGRLWSLLRDLLNHRVEAVLPIAARIVSLADSPLAAEQDKAAVAAAALFVDSDDCGWEIVWPAVEDNVNFGLKVFEQVASEERWGEPGTRVRLTEWQLTSLFIWLAKNGRMPSLTDDGGAVGPVEQLGFWTLGILEELCSRGTRTACDGIRRAQQELPHFTWLQVRLQKAEKLTRKRTWAPIKPAELWRLVESPRKRVVRFGGDLLEILLESLARLDVRLQGETPAAPFLWNEVGDKHYEPKEEAGLSNFIKLHLEDDIRHCGIVVNREVEIRGGNGGSPGENTDIHVDVLTTGSAGQQEDRISVVIEVKGCWNKGVQTDMQDQLAERYLKDNASPFGLYVVGWYACRQWSSTDYRNGKTPKWDLKQAREFLDQQALALSDSTRTIRAFVLNCALRQRGPSKDCC